MPGAVEGGSDARLPAAGVLRLDEEPGIERLYLLASTRPLLQVEELFGDGRPQVDEAWLIDLRDHYARNGTLTRQVRNEAVRVDYRQRGRGAAVVFETVVIRHYVPEWVAARAVAVAATGVNASPVASQRPAHEGY